MASIEEIRIRDLRALVEAAAVCEAGKALYPAPTKRLRRLGRLLDCCLLDPGGQELTADGWALVSRAVTVLAAAETLLDKGLPLLPLREQDHLIAIACLECGLLAIRNTLTDGQRERVLTCLREGLG